MFDGQQLQIVACSLEQYLVRFFMQSALEMPSRWAFGGALRKPVPASECRLASRPVYQRGCSTAPAGEPAEPPAGAAAVLGCGQARHRQPARGEARLLLFSRAEHFHSSPFRAELCVLGRGAGILLAPALITAIVPPRAPSGWIYYSTLLRVWPQYLKW